MGDALADPVRYENLFPGLAESLKAEQFLRQLAALPIPAAANPPSNAQRNLIDEMHAAVESGTRHTLIMHDAM